jgi:hypothetical protein
MKVFKAFLKSYKVTSLRSSLFISKSKEGSSSFKGAIAAYQVYALMSELENPSVSSAILLRALSSSFTEVVMSLILDHSIAFLASKSGIPIRILIGSLLRAAVSRSKGLLVAARINTYVVLLATPST